MPDTFTRFCGCFNAILTGGVLTSYSETPISVNGAPEQQQAGLAALTARITLADGTAPSQGYQIAVPPARPAPDQFERSPGADDRLTAPAPDLRRSRWWHRLMVACTALLGTAAVGAAIGLHLVHARAGGIRVTVGWPGMQYLIYAAWLVPLGELALLIAGQLFYRYRFRAAPGKFRHLIIQVTTTGREQDRVNEVIGQIRGYRLRMSHEIWVVTEPGHRDRYPQADRVLTVPASFTARSERKARALEYSRRVRVTSGLDGPDVKILFNDDDVAPTRGYIERAFIADYDICEGITAPRAEYAVRPFGHFLTSHADDMRTHACLVYCSVFQGILGRPLHVHGEGLTVTGQAESRVTWDWPAFASEDLVFGQRAVRAGLRWGWFHEYVELTSPWNIRDFMTQRRRWLWGDIHGVIHRDVLTLPGAMVVVAKYLVGLVTLVFSLTGLFLKLTGQMPAASPIYSVSKLSIAAWLAVFFTCGWIGASSRVSGRNDDSRLLNAIAAVVMVPLGSLLTLAGLFIPLVQGNPRTFQVISKTRQVSPREKIG